VKIGCVLVLYNPDKVITNKCIDMLLSQVDVLVLIDNSPCANLDYQNGTFEDRKCIYKFLGGNVGIAAAQNEGIRILKGTDINYLLFMDQDSIPPLNMLCNLLDGVRVLEQKSVILGAIGPRAVNRQDLKAYKGSVRKGVGYNEDLTEVTELISSGTLIPFHNFDIVGDMDSSLFIDGVDHEWCWRARHKMNARFFILESVQLSHQLGEGDRSFLGVRIPIPSPFRVYYQFRNYFFLIRRDYVPLYWKISNGIKYVLKMFYYPFFISPRIKYLTRILNGMYAGIFVKKK